MPDRADLIYTYDGSFDGLLCCVFTAFERKERPWSVIPENECQPSLFDVIYVETRLDHARRVLRGIRERISAEAAELVTDGYLCGCQGKELLILDFLLLGFSVGRRVTDMLGDPTVSKLSNAVRALYNEAHLLRGFVRFSIRDGVKTAVIEPKNYVLPILAPFFADRFPNEIFLIYDRTHRMALVYRPREWGIMPVESFEQPPADEQEQRFRELWRLFYDTIAIKERENPRCRMGHMPKRYWSQLTELNGSLAERRSIGGRSD